MRGQRVPVSRVWGRSRVRVSAVEFVPKLVEHVDTRLVLGNPEDELGTLSGREDSLSERISKSRGGGADEAGRSLPAR